VCVGIRGAKVGVGSRLCHFVDPDIQLVVLIVVVRGVAQVNVRGEGPAPTSVGIKLEVPAPFIRDTVLVTLLYGLRFIVSGITVAVQAHPVLAVGVLLLNGPRLEQALVVRCPSNALQYIRCLSVARVDTIGQSHGPTYHGENHLL